MKKTNLLIVATMSLGLTLAPVSTSISKLIGQSNVAEAKKQKPLTQQEFNKKVAELGRTIKEYKQYVKEWNAYITEYRSANAEMFGSLFEEETIDLTEDELVTFYLKHISDLTADNSGLEDYLESYEIDELSTYIDDVAKTNSNTNKINAKINEYEKKYVAEVKAKKFDSALKIRNEQVKLYYKLVSELNNVAEAEEYLNETLYYIVEQYDGYEDDEYTDEDSEDVIDEDYYYDNYSY
ncbi:hypothetical protein [Bacillus sp. OAE603]|uniref:hypothetical protein n=1 Tax=Gottfriedia sp. OAE603 TaxID=2663872 RepID=UPI001789E7EC